MQAQQISELKVDLREERERNLSPQSTSTQPQNSPSSKSSRLRISWNYVETTRKPLLWSKTGATFERRLSFPSKFSSFLNSTHRAAIRLNRQQQQRKHQLVEWLWLNELMSYDNKSSISGSSWVVSIATNPLFACWATFTIYERFPLTFTFCRPVIIIIIVVVVVVVVAVLFLPRLAFTETNQP